VIGRGARHFRLRQRALPEVVGSSENNERKT
jgi:hypothetical protein